MSNNIVSINSTIQERSILEKFKSIFRKEIVEKQLSKNESILLIYEQGRISREEYLLLISSEENVTINIELDNTVHNHNVINANNNTIWGGFSILGDNYGDIR